MSVKIDKEKILNRLLKINEPNTDSGKEAWANSFQTFFTKETQPLRQRKTKLKIPAGKGISIEMLETDSLSDNDYSVHD